MGLLILLFFFVLFVPLVALVRSWAFIKLWSWSAVPWLGLDTPGLGEAYILMLLIGLFTSGVSRDAETDADLSRQGRIIVRGGTSFLGPVLMVLIGWCVHQF